MTPSERSTAGNEVIRAGFIPLVDAAPLVVASRLGFAEAEGLRIELLRETSWATLRDRLAVRHLDIAHMLGPMALADSLGLTPLPVGLIVPMALGTAGNTVTVSRAVRAELAELGAGTSLDASSTAEAVARLTADRQRTGKPPLTIAIVHPYSAHHYQLAYWLGFAGVRPGIDVELVIVPPSLMTAALESARIDGFCVGEPWGSAAVALGAGHVLTTSAHIWHRSPDKVLGVRHAFAEASPERLGRLLRAIYKAACWCDDAANHQQLARLLSASEIIGQPAEVITSALAMRGAGGPAATTCGDGFLSFAADGAMLARESHAVWFYSQMVRWGQATLDAKAIAAIKSVYRPDLFSAAVETKSGDTASDVAFFDGTSFDATDIPGYLRRFAIREA